MAQQQQPTEEQRQAAWAAYFAQNPAAKAEHERKQQQQQQQAWGEYNKHQNANQAMQLQQLQQLNSMVQQRQQQQQQMFQQHTCVNSAARTDAGSPVTPTVLPVPRSVLQLPCLAPHSLADAAVGAQRAQQLVCPVDGDELVDPAVAGDGGRGGAPQRLTYGAQHL